MGGSWCQSPKDWGGRGHQDATKEAHGTHYQREDPKDEKKRVARRKLDSLGGIKSWSGLANTEERIRRLKGRLELADALSEISRINQLTKNAKKRKLMAEMMVQGPAALKKLREKNMQVEKLTVKDLRAIAFWYFHENVSGKKARIVKKLEHLMDKNPEAFDECDETHLARLVRNDNKIEDNDEGVEMDQKEGEEDGDNEYNVEEAML